MSHKFFYVFAGPNGSGKSTIIGSLIEKKENVLYVNADYVSKNVPEIRRIKDQRIKDLEAWKRTEIERDRYMLGSKSFAWETVFSHPSRLEVIKEAKKHGFFVYLMYVTTYDPQINLKRVEKRRQQKGHDVPPDKIKLRYHRSMGFLADILELVDEARVYDNSMDGQPPSLIFIKSYENQELAWVNYDIITEQVNAWVNKYILSPLNAKGIEYSAYTKEQTESKYEE